MDDEGGGKDKVFLNFLVPVFVKSAHNPCVGLKNFPGPRTIFFGNFTSRSAFSVSTRAVHSVRFTGSLAGDNGGKAGSSDWEFKVSNFFELFFLTGVDLASDPGCLSGKARSP